MLRIQQLTLLALALALAGCGPGFSGDGTGSTNTIISESGDGDPGDGDPGDGDPGDGDGDPPPPGPSSVDVLFVVDNSGSMGNQQAILANSIDVLVDAIEAAGGDYRIGVTTTDNGNPWCPSGTTTPEAGNLVLSSCKDRLPNFMFNNGDVDASDVACNDICTLSSPELEIQPTTTAVDPNASPRPWVERIGGQTNLPPGTDMSEALRCFLPQGINGCGFESQLESMYLALIRAQDSNEASYGFLRADAILAVVFLTDEADCSYSKEWAQIFEQDGNKAFWADPTDSFPTSAVCWNAGVNCTGDPNAYSSCDPVNNDVNGNGGASDADAVLHPIGRYLGLLEGLEAQKKELALGREIVVGLIGGVGGDGVPFYSDVDATDPDFQHSFGIGPGCSGSNPQAPNEPSQAVPPVRLRDVAEGMNLDMMFSICEPNYDPALLDVAERIIEQF